LKFFYQKREHKVTELLGTFKGDLSPKDLAYLVQTQDGDVYLLYLHLFDPSSQSFLSTSLWILCFRVLREKVVEFEDLFKVENVRPVQQTTEMPTMYLACWGCGQQVLKNRAIEFQGKFYCILCFQALDNRGPTQNLH